MCVLCVCVCVVCILKYLYTITLISSLLSGSISTKGVMHFIIIFYLSLYHSPCDRPRIIESLRGIEVSDIAAGGAHSACITTDGMLYTWGKGRYGRLGHGDSEDRSKPKLVRNNLEMSLYIFG